MATDVFHIEMAADGRETAVRAPSDSRKLLTGDRSADTDRIERCDLTPEVDDDDDDDGDGGGAVDGTQEPERTPTEDNFQSGSDCGRVAVNSFRRWSANFGRSVKNNRRTVYNKTIRLMPSRIQKTLSIDGDLITTSVPDVEHITLELELRDQLMEDNPVAEQLRIEAIKSIAQTLSMKRRIRENLSYSVNRRASRSKSYGLVRRVRYGVKLYANRLMKKVRHLAINFELFYGSMKQIEGHFGSRVSAYFKFLRWMLMLNVLLTVFVGSFVTFPQLLYNRQQASSGESVGSGSGSFQFVDLLTGEGYLADSILFYGAYSNQSFTVVPGTAEYSLPHAYFLTITVLTLATFVIVSVAMARSYRNSFIEASGSVKNVLTHKIFCAWDFGIANEKAARLKHGSIHHELREYLQHRNRPTAVQGRWQRYRRRALHVAAHLLVLLLNGLVGFGLWMLLDRFGGTPHFSSWSALYVSLVTNATMVAFHYVFRFIERLERYPQPSTALNINLMRHFLLEITIVGALLVHWLGRAGTAARPCWETAIGQEIYRLIVVDFLLATVLLSVLRGVRYAVHRHYSATVPLSQFCITHHSLGLIYNQTLLWFGLLFAPLLVPLVALKLLATFYVNKRALITFCRPPTKLWRSRQTLTLFLVLVFVSLFGVLLTHGYIMTQVPVSGRCGPFRGNRYMYQLFMQGILKLREEHLFWKVFVYVTKPAIIGGLLLAMTVVAYYLRAKSRAQIAKVRLLKELLCMEAKDKEFLLANISRITRGKDTQPADRELLGGGRRHRRQVAPDRYCADPSGTWRYEESPRKASGGMVPLAGDPATSAGYQRFEDEEKLRMRRF